MAVDYTTAITDRSENDLMRILELDAQRFVDMTLEEQTEWLAGLKATYNASDLNRVGGFILDLAEKLHDIAGITVDVAPKVDWNMTDIPTQAQLNKYISDIQTVKAALNFVSPEIPDTVSNLTLECANAIEQMCVNLNQALTRMEQSGFFCDELFSGEAYM